MRNLISVILFMFLFSCGGDIEPDTFFKRFMKSKGESLYEFSDSAIDHCQELNPDAPRGRCDVRNCLSNPIVMEGLNELTEKVAALLDKHSIRYWLDGGSLIGQQRFQAHMPWDDDVDVGVIQEEFMPKIFAFRKDVEGAGLAGILQHSLPTFTSQSAYIIAYTESSFKVLAQRTAEKYGFKISQDEAHAMWVENFEYGEQFPRIDVEFFHHDKEEKELYYVNTYFSHIVLKEDDIFPVEKENIVGVEVSIPAKTDDYLDKVYPKADGKILWDWVMGSEHNPKCRQTIRYSDIKKEKPVRELIKTYLEHLWGSDKIQSSKVLDVDPD